MWVDMKTPFATDVFQLCLFISVLFCAQSQNVKEEQEKSEIGKSQAFSDSSSINDVSEIFENDEVSVTFFAKSGLDVDLEDQKPVAAPDLDYMIIASKILRPNTVFRVSCVI